MFVDRPGPVAVSSTRDVFELKDHVIAVERAVSRPVGRGDREQIESIEREREWRPERDSRGGKIVEREEVEKDSGGREMEESVLEKEAGERGWSGEVDGERGEKILEGKMRREKGGG